MRNLVLLFGCTALLVAVVGCSQEPTRQPPTSGVDGSKYVLSAKPEDARGVIKVRKDAKDGDDVVVVGRIGGSDNPWIEGMAAFTIVDPKLKHCHELGDDGCLKPWDFC